MKFYSSTSTLNLKIFLVIIALLISLSTLFYTYDLVEKLQNKEKQLAEMYAASIRYLASPVETGVDYSFILDEVIKRIDFPLIQTDGNNDFSIINLNATIRNLEIDSTLSEGELEAFLRNKISELDEIRPPIDIYFQDIVLARVHYGDSDLVKKLKFYPYLQIIFALFFVSIAYLSFSYVKRSEQSNIWVGMSKETAHQLGTPISSLMGWYEYLKLSYKDPDKVNDIAEEINNDLSRLNKIAHRFSKIGSQPVLAKDNIFDIVQSVVFYYQRRIPQTGKNVKILIEGNQEITALVNKELFEWVLENLTKNALDAIENNKGIIQFRIAENPKFVIIEVEDSGKGIDLKKRKEIFRPGYSTKKRGWGLGLSLSKRIVKDYHKGKIFVKNSVINEGTVFQICLRK